MRSLLETVRVRFSPLGRAVAWFQRHRANYYEYLCDIMEGTAGKKTMLDIFQDDAVRYEGSHRGVLSAHWAYAFQDVSGGELQGTFAGTVPDDDVMIIGVGQTAGSGALEDTLRDLADYTRLAEQARSGFLSTAMAGVACMGVLILMLALIPYVTFPQLAKTFSALPEDAWVGAAGSLRAAAGFLGANLFILLGSLGVLFYILAWSLPHWTGAMRVKFDDYFIWRIYRDFQAIRFMMVLATILKPRGNRSPKLRDGLLMLSAPDKPWLNWHVEQMIDRIDKESLIGPETFDTGLLNQELYFYLNDVCRTQGLDAGLQRTRRQVEVKVLADVARRATVVRWSLMLSAVVGTVVIFMWHFAAIESLRRALQLFYGS